MDIECPSCRYPISDEVLIQTRAASGDDEVAGEQTALTCPNCGSNLSAIDQETHSLHVESGADGSRKFAHFQLLRILGRGGFGTVWLADDLRLERQVALKLPVPKRRDTSNLMREAKTAAKLRHPNIVSVYEVGESDGQVFIVCEYIDGMDLNSLLRKGLLPESRVIELLRAIASGLHHAHENQIVHRDMKPANVLVEVSGTPLVTDFGLAMNVDVEESISSKGKIVGTILYMAPEQANANADRVDRRADIYSIGVMMYEMLTGERPFRGNVQAILRQKMSDDPALLRQLRPSVPLDLETICLKCLQRSPARRYATALEFNDELDRYSKGLPILARPVSRIEYTWRWCIRNRAVASLLTMLFLSLSIGLAGTTFYWLRARDETEKTRRSLYASQMNLANNSLSYGDIEATSQVLDRFLAPELRHFRGFEWHFLQHNVERFRQSLRHGKRIEGIAMSRDGDWFASIADDRALRVWNSQSGRQMREIPFKVGRWQTLAISRRDNELAAGARDGTVYTWNAIHDAESQPRVVKHGPGVTKVKFSADGKRLFSGGAKGAIRVWDTATYEPIQDIPTGQDGLVDFDISKDGTVLVIVGAEGAIRVWDVDTRNLTCLIRDKRRVEAVAVSPRGDRFIAGTYGSYLLAYETRNGSELYSQDTRYDWITDVEFLAATSIVAICSSKGGVAFFDVDTRGEVGWLETHDGAGGTISVSNNGKSLVVGSITGAIKLLDIADYQQPSVMSSDVPVRDVRLIADQVIVAAYEDGSVQQLDFQQQTVRVLKEPTGGSHCVICASSQPALIGIAEPDGSIELLDSSGELITSIPGSGSKAVALALSRRGDFLVAATESGLVKGYSIQRDRVPIASERFSISAISDARIRDICLSSDQQTIAVALGNNEVRFIEIAKATWNREILSLESIPVSIEFADADLVVGTRDGVLSRFDVRSRTRIWSTKAHAGHLNMITVIPGGNAVASVGRDKDLHIWDLVNGDLRVRLFRHERQIFAVKASADGKTLVTGGLEGDVRIWRTKSGR